MAAGELLAAEVAGVLHTQNAKTVSEITAELGGIVSTRAVRYAVRMLIEAGRAKRVGRAYCHYKVLAVVEEPREQASASG
jgi:repressor of nif and glnA expression